MSETEGTENVVTPESDGTEGTTMLGKTTKTEEVAQGGDDATKGAEGAEGGEGQENSADTDGKTDETKEDGVPDEYEDFVVPDGMEVDEKAMEAFKPLAKELELTQAQAQKLVDFYNEGTKTTADESQEYYSNLMNEWQETVRNDKEIGGKEFDNSLSAARKALDAFATPELYEIFEATGMGNHPEMVRVFARIGKAVKEDAIRIGGAQTTGPKDPADVLFPNHK